VSGNPSGSNPARTHVIKIYLDDCCLNRPFDNQAQNRIAIEAAAIVRVLELVEAGMVSDYSSEMAQVEIEQIPDADRRRKVKGLLPPSRRIPPLTTHLLDEAEKFVRRGFKLADAVHLAAAAELDIDVFLTVDDDLLKRARKNAYHIGVTVRDPVSFVREMSDEHDR